MIPDVNETKPIEFTGERLLPSLGQSHIQIVYEHFHRYHFACQFVQGSDVVDIACGEGYGAALLAQNAKSVIGIDCDKPTIDAATEKYLNKTLTFKVGKCQKIPLPKASADIVISFETIEHFTEQELFLKEVKRILKEGGKLIISSPNKDEYSKENVSTNIYHKKELTRSEFRDLLLSHFRYVQMADQKLVCGSYIVSEQSEKDNLYGIYTGGLAEPKYTKGIPNALYSLAVCSDYPLPSIPLGIWEDSARSAEIWHTFEEMPAQIAAYRRLESEYDQRTKWAIDLDNQLEAERLQAKRLATEFEERTNWALRLDTELKEAHTQAEASRARIQELETTQRQAIEQKAILQKSKELSDQRFAELLRQNGDIIREIERQSKHGSLLETELKTARESEISLSTQMALARQQIAEFHKHTALYDAKINNAAEQIAVLENELKETRKIIELRDHTLISSKQELAALQQQNAILAERLATTGANEQRMTREFEKTRTELLKQNQLLIQETKQRTDHITTMNQQIEEERKAFEMRMIECKAEITRLRGENIKLIRDIEGRSEHAMQLSHELLSRQREIDSRKSDAKKLDEELNITRQLVDRVNLENQTSQTQLQQTRRNLEQIQQDLVTLEESRRKDAAYWDHVHSLSAPTLGNWFKAFRFPLNLTAEWLFGGLFSSVTHHRFRHVKWHIEEPKPRFVYSCGSDVTINIRFQDVDGNPAKYIYAILGNRRVIADQNSVDADGYFHYRFRFRTKPGWKFLKLYAKLSGRADICLGYRLLRVKVVPESAAKPKVFSAPQLPSLPANVIKVPLLRPEDINLKSCGAPLISIIIPIYNQTAYTLRCLQAIALHVNDTPYEIILIDDCSPEADIMLLRKVKRLRYFRNKTNRGFVLNCNYGASLARGKYVLMLNNDTEIQPGCIESLVETFNRVGDAGLVGAKLIYPDGTLQEAGGIIWRDGSAWNYGRNDNPEKPEYNYLKEVDYCSGACIMVPRDLFKKLGGFDESYCPAYCEDSDLAFRIRAAGKKVYFQPAAVVVHYEGKSNGTDTAEGVKKHQVINNKKLLERWSQTFRKEHFPNAINVFRARERSISKKVILIIDHYIPHYDQDAGSRTMWSYINFFVQSGFSVKFIGDNFHPHQPYLNEMQQLGVEVLWGSWYGSNWERWLENVGMEIDYVLLSRAHVVRRYLSPIKRCTKAKILFYGHDLLSRTYTREYAVTQNPEAFCKATEWRQMEEEVFQAVDVAYYPSNEEVKFLKEHYSHPSFKAVPAYIFSTQIPCSYAETFNERRGLLFVGGFRHGPNISAIVWFCREVLPKIKEQIPEIRLTIVGSHPTQEILDLASSTVTVTGYVNDQRLTELYENHKLVIVPLLNGGGVKGKVVEALWRGMPIVTTEVGAEGIPMAHTVMEVVAQNNMADCIVKLLSNHKRLEEMANRGGELIAKCYSVQALRDILGKDIAFPTS